MEFPMRKMKDNVQKKLLILGLKAFFYDIISFKFLSLLICRIINNFVIHNGFWYNVIDNIIYV